MIFVDVICSCTKKMAIRTLDYYFGKKGDSAGVAGPSPGPKSPHRQPTFNIVIDRRKQAVGRPRKSS